MKIRVGGDQDVLVISDVVRDGGRGPVGQLGAGHGQAGLVVHWHAGVVVLHLHQTRVRIRDQGYYEPAPTWRVMWLR